MPRKPKAKAELEATPIAAFVPPAPLPQDPAEFAAMLRTLETPEQRKRVYEQITDKFPGYSSIRRDDVPHLIKPAERQLFEQRVLAFTEEPRFELRYFRDLESSTRHAWRDLVALRSRLFAERLTGWAAGRDDVLAGEALEHLAWMGYCQDLPVLTKAIGEATYRQVAAVSRGCELSLRHALAERGFVDTICELVTPFIHGSVAFSDPPPDSVDLRSDAGKAILELLLCKDRPGGLRLLGSSKVLRPDNPLLEKVLWTLLFESEADATSVGSVIDKQPIIEVYNAIWSRPEGDPTRSSLGGIALVLGVLAHPEHFAPEVRRQRFAAKTDEALRPLVNAAARRLRVVPDAQTLIGRYAEVRTKLRSPAREVLAAGALALEVVGDGLAVTLSNRGELWPDAARGLELIGRKDAASALTRAATFAFGEQAASITSEQATEALAALLEELPAELERACELYEERNESVLPAVQRYIDRRPAPFRI